MTKNILLDKLKEFTVTAVKDMIMPVALQKGDASQQHRAAVVYRQRVPDVTSATKKAPYILHQIITGADKQTAGENTEATATVRSVFVVYNDEDNEEGGLMLLNIMERLRISLLKTVVIGDQFQLDLQAGIESLIYPDDTAPFFMGEFVSVWRLPAIEREVTKWLN